MLINDTAAQALNTAFALADKQGLSMVVLIADSEHEECEVLCNPEAMTQDTAIQALEIFVDSIRDAREQTDGKLEN